MPLPQIQKTWRFVANQQYPAQATTLDDHRAVLLGIKDALLDVADPDDSAWTVVRSCDGGAVGDAEEDTWETASDLVWASSGGRSWIVLRQLGIGSPLESPPAGAEMDFQICVELNSDVPWCLTLVCSLEGFENNGTTSSRPTAPDEMVLLDGAAGNFWLGGHTSPASFVLHVMKSSDGQCTRIAVYSGNLIMLWWQFDRAQNPVDGWDRPAVVCGISATGPSDNAPTYGKLISTGSPLLRGRASGEMALFMTAESFGTFGYPVGVSFIGPNDLDGNWPMTPIGLASLTPDNRGRHGQIFDLWFGSTAAGEGDTYPGDTSRQFAQLGDLIVPWNGSIVVTS